MVLTELRRRKGKNKKRFMKDMIFELNLAGGVGRGRHFIILGKDGTRHKERSTWRRASLAGI